MSYTKLSQLQLCQNNQPIL